MIGVSTLERLETDILVLGSGGAGLFAVGEGHGERLIRCREGVDAGGECRLVYVDRIAACRQVVEGVEAGGAREADEPASVVAPVRRSAAPKRVRLTESQVAVAKQLGVPLEQYAREAAKEPQIEQRR